LSVTSRRSVIRASVILSEAAASQSEAATQSKDPYFQHIRYPRKIDKPRRARSITKVQVSSFLRVPSCPLWLNGFENWPTTGRANGLNSAHDDMFLFAYGTISTATPDPWAESGLIQIVALAGSTANWFWSFHRAKARGPKGKVTFLLSPGASDIR
jgi:hypothetical protein